MSESTISEKERNQIDKILSFGINKHAGMPTPKPDPNSKTTTTSVIQGGIRTTTTTLKPIRRASFIEELHKVLNLGTDRYH